MFNVSSLLQQMSVKYAAVEAVFVVANRSCQTMQMSLMKLHRLSRYSRPLVIFLIRSVLSSVPRASVPAPIEAPPGKFGENARAFSASAIANPTQLEPPPGNLCKVPAARSLPLPVPPPPPPLLATVSAPSASIAPTSCLRTEHQTRLTPIVCENVLIASDCKLKQLHHCRNGLLTAQQLIIACNLQFHRRRTKT